MRQLGFIQHKALYAACENAATAPEPSQPRWLANATDITLPGESRIQRKEALAMHAAERLDAALALARRLGYKIRLECLYGQTGGYCEIQGQKWLFIDLTLSPQEQLEQVVEALRTAAPQTANASAA